MTLYLKGYYGYQNRGDELLLLGVFQYIYTRYKDLAVIYIEAGDVCFLQQRLSQNKEIIGEEIYTKISIVSKRNIIQFFPRVMKIIGGGEVITDARKAPHNGWNYLGLYWLSLLFGNVIFLGGIGEPKSGISRILWTILLKGAKKIIVREQISFDRVIQYTKNVALHRDFAFDVLDSIKSKVESIKPNNNYIIINCNSHYWNDEVITRIQDFCGKYPDHSYIYFPAAMGDDSDVPYFDVLKQSIPTIELYDWRKHLLQETLMVFAGAHAGIATRLHVLLPLQYFTIPLEAFVYQEKISKILGIHSNTP